MAELISYDVTDVEETGGGTGVKIKPGLRIGQIMKIERRTEKANGDAANDLKVSISFGDAFDWGFTYVGLGEASDWKLAELVRALGLPKKGKINPEKINKEKPLIRVKVNHGTYEGNYSPDLGTLFPPQKGDSLEMNLSSLEAAAAEGEEGIAEGAQEPEPTDVGSHGHEYPNGFEPSREGEEFGAYDDWTDEDLEAEAMDRNLTLPGGRASKRNKFIAALRADDEEAAGGGDDGDDPSAEAAAEGGDNYEDLDTDALIAEYEARNFEEPVPSFRGSNSEQRKRDAMIEKLREDDAADPFGA